MNYRTKHSKDNIFKQNKNIIFTYQMATPDQFRYEFLQEGQWLYLDGGGALNRSDTLVALPESPKGWDEITKTWTRGDKSLGVYTRTSTPVSFHGASKSILEQIYFIDGGVDYEAKVLFRISKLRSSDWLYDLGFEGELDFTTVKIGGEDDNVYFNININESGLVELLDSNSNIEYEIEFDGTARDINHDGIDLALEYKFSVREYSVLDNIFDDTYVPFVPLSFDGLYPVIESYTVGAVNLLTSNPMDNKLFVPQIDITDGSLNLIGNVEYYNGFSAGVSIKLLFRLLIFRNQDYNTPAVDVEIYKDPSFLASGASRSLSINATYDIDFLEGDYVVITYGIETSGAGAGSFDANFNILDMFLRGNYRLPSSLVTSYSTYELVEQMVDKVSGGTAVLQSTLLSTNSASADDLAYKFYGLIPGRLRLTSAEAVRNITNEPKIKWTWEDCLQFLQAEFGVGVGVETGKVIIEVSNYFMNATEIINIGEVKNLSISNANDYISNSIKAGYPDKEYQDINGRDIVHSEVNYSLGITRVKNELNLLAPIIADPYAIEQLRGYQFKPTTDNPNDNEVVAIYCQDNPNPDTDNFQIQRYTDTQNGGVYSPTTFYNQALYPMLMVYRNLPWLKSIKNVLNNVSQAGKKAIFESGLRNTEASVKLGTPYTIVQNEDVLLNNVSEPPTPAKLFIPVVYDFEHEPINNLFATILNNKYGYITFTSQGKTYHGYVLNIDMVSSDKDVYTFKLLGAAI